MSYDSKVLRLKGLMFYGESWGNVYTPCLLIIITLRFTCGENKILSDIKKSQNIDYDFLQNFLLLFISLLTAQIVNSSRVLAVVYLIFFKNSLKQAWKTFNVKFGPQWKYRKSSYQVRPILAIFYKVVALF